MRFARQFCLEEGGHWQHAVDFQLRVGSDEPFQAKFFVYFRHAQITLICRDGKTEFWFCEIKQGAINSLRVGLLLLFRQQDKSVILRPAHHIPA